LPNAGRAERARDAFNRLYQGEQGGITVRGTGPRRPRGTSRKPPFSRGWGFGGGGVGYFTYRQFQAAAERLEVGIATESCREIPRLTIYTRASRLSMLRPIIIVGRVALRVDCLLFERVASKSPATDTSIVFTAFGGAASFSTIPLKRL